MSDLGHGFWTSRLSDYAIQGLNAKPRSALTTLEAVGGRANFVMKKAGKSPNPYKVAVTWG